MVIQYYGTPTPGWSSTIKESELVIWKKKFKSPTFTLEIIQTILVLYMNRGMWFISDHHEKKLTLETFFQKKHFENVSDLKKNDLVF
jgi:hypothetical protein